MSDSFYLRSSWKEEKRFDRERSTQYLLTKIECHKDSSTVLIECNKVLPDKKQNEVIGALVLVECKHEGEESVEEEEGGGKRK